MRKNSLYTSIALSFCLFVLPISAFASDFSGIDGATVCSRMTADGIEIESTESYSSAEQTIVQQINNETASKISDGDFLGSVDIDSKMPLAITHGSRPYYFNRYGKAQYVTSGYHYVSGQPAGGYRFQNSTGTIYISASQGGSFSISHTFAGFGTFGISFPFGRANNAVIGVGVSILKGGYWKVKMSTTNRCVPYTTYRVANGKTTVYFKGVSSLFYSRSFSRVRVK
ncbi:hypothetical protein SAMN04489857_1405 [Parafannyhessea umbonata]|uniref:DUF1134 domain-containing protein n=2 Tax=Parafannyhessea umbonata TaxID=604330 RepID=A0A1H1MFS6_9ACTN|nr:hypothetical protein SAMN04489857_1405 [Parafannyhessea umbonata]